MPRKLYSGIVLTLLACVSLVAHADEYVGTDLKVLDPVIAPSGYATSSGYQLWSTVSQVGIGTSSSASFGVRSGFEYFPFVTTPVLSASAASDTQINVSWTAAEAFLGWSVGSYSVGRSTSSSGPYTFTNVGTNLSSNETGLTAETAYYFVVTVQDAFGRIIATSTEASATTQAAGATDSGGNGNSSGQTRGEGPGQVSVSGYAHPGGTVFFLFDGVLARNIVVDNDGEFDITLEDLQEGSYLLTMYGVDINGVKSGLLSFPITITSASSLVYFDGIFIPPTIELYPQGDLYLVSGYTIPGAEVGIITTDGKDEFMQTVTANSNGQYGISFPADFLLLPSRVLKSLASVNGIQSPFGLALRPFYVSSERKGDFNEDGRVNLIDFSILAYWHERENPPAYLDLNGDGVISLVDFSILTFYWTG